MLPSRGYLKYDTTNKHFKLTADRATGLQRSTVLPGAVRIMITTTIVYVSL